MSFSTNGITKYQFLTSLAASELAYRDIDNTDFIKTHVFEKGWKSIALKLDSKLSKFVKHGNVLRFEDGSSDADAIFLKKGNNYILSFTGTEDKIQDILRYGDSFITKTYLNNYSSLLNAISRIPGIKDANIIVTGHSLGAAAANLLAETGNKLWKSVFGDAKYVTFESPYMVTNGNIFNFGIENDKIYGHKLSNIFGSKNWKDKAVNNFYFADNESIEKSGLISKGFFAHKLVNVVPVLDRMFGDKYQSELPNIDLFAAMGPDTFVFAENVVGGFDMKQVTFSGPPLKNKEWLIVGENRADLIIGSNLSDIILGFSGNDDLQGGGGRDMLIGGSGNDRLSGGNGEDLFIGGAGRDSIDGGEGLDVAYIIRDKIDPQIIDFKNSSDGNFIQTNQGDRYKGVENFHFTDVADKASIRAESFYLMGGGDDQVTIYTRANIFGDSGNDHFVFWADQASVTGGSGKDLFSVRSFTEVWKTKYITISDFVSGEDKIDLSQFDGNLSASGIQKWKFDGVVDTFDLGAALGFFAIGSTGRFYAYDEGNKVTVHFEQDGDTFSNLGIVIYTKDKISASDFIF